MNGDHQSSDEERATRRLHYSRTDRVDLELLTVSAISEHRRLFAADQSVYEEWESAFADPNIPRTITQSLQSEYLRRRAKTAAQQEVLADLIDCLGYIPDVPATRDD